MNIFFYFFFYFKLRAYNSNNDNDNNNNNKKNKKHEIKPPVSERHLRLRTVDPIHAQVSSPDVTCSTRF